MMAKRTFEMDMDEIPPSVSLYFLDLLRYRNLSQAIAEKFNVKHESPQIILIDSGHSIYNASHSDISAKEIGELIPA
jgi:bacillithiol system protein YtxJ